MAKKKTVSKIALITFYMDFVLLHDNKPKTVYAFAKENNFEEQEFYKFFSSFDTLEQSIFQEFFKNAIKVLNKSEDYLNYNSRNKLLSFYYTFFETLTANRSYVVYALKNTTNLKSIKALTLLKTDFTNYVASLDITLLDINQEQFQKIQNKGLKETAWLQLLIILKFWLDDTSSAFEKTDLFIEKSINTSFDIIDKTPLNSIIDLGKFLFKEYKN